MSKLSVLVAQRVMGWKWYVRRDSMTQYFYALLPPDNGEMVYHPSGYGGLFQMVTGGEVPKPCSVSYNCPAFDSNISDAWEVFDKFPQATIKKDGDTYEVDIGEAQADSNNKCKAICLAALRAVGMTDAEIGEALK